MSRSLLRSLLALATLLAAPMVARADSPYLAHGGWYGGWGSYIAPSIRTPPYFAVRPPVYYGDQYARPYGISPYPAPPQVTAPPSYQARQMTSAATVRSNPYCEGCNATRSIRVSEPTVAGPVRTNPFVAHEARVAER